MSDISALLQFNKRVHRNKERDPGKQRLLGDGGKSENKLCKCVLQR